MDASKKTINDIFNGNRVLEIPFFQRAYVWGENQWERLLQDMKLITISKKPYFLGSVILKQKPTSTSSGVGDMRTLIDGQQRLTTLNIFFKVLCLKTDSNASFERRFKLEDGELALWHNHNDIESFKKVLNLENLDELENTDSIIKAYNFFKNKIDVEKVDRQTILNNIMFVGVDLDENEDEQQIFDTINSLGLRLTTAELLKNHLFNRTERDLYNTYWQDVFEKNNKTKNYWDREITTGRAKRTFIDLFFYSYLQIKAQETDIGVKSEDRLEFSKLETLFDSYKTFLKNYLNINGKTKKDILEDIKSYAKVFKENFDYDVVDKELTADFGIKRITTIIFGLETSTLIPYTLYALKNIENEIDRNELFEILESYIMRRMVSKSSSRNYNQFFTYRLIYNKVLSKKEFKEHIIEEQESNLWANDEQLKAGFETSVLINRQATGIIYFLESRIRDRDKHATQLLGLNKYSLEHLMPKKWENKWESVSTQDLKDFRNQNLKTLGNLAIITQSLNSSIRDSNWQTKKNGNESKTISGLKHYSSGIETLAPYLDLQEWNEVEIKKRADYFYEMALKNWKSEGLNE
jgi:uncharacterized protein with ParB-like and HNH nuclease domain